MSEPSQILDQDGVRDAAPAYQIGPLELIPGDVSPGYKRTEAGVIPEDWGISSVGDKFSIQLGKMLDAAKNSGTLKPYIGNRAVQWSQVDLTEISTVRMTSSDLQRFRLRKGDLLVCEGGEIGRAAIWDEPIPECYYQKALHRLRTRGSFEAYLMMYFLEFWALAGKLNNFVTQTSIAHLPKDKLEIVPLPVPARPEQRAIATALSDADALIESLDRLIAKKRAIKQAAMQQLLTGQTRLPGFSGEWMTIRLGDVVTFYKGSGLPKTALVDAGHRLCIHYGELFTHYGELITTVTSKTNSKLPSVMSVENDVLMPTSDVTPTGLSKASCLAEKGVVLGGDILIIRSQSEFLDGTFLAYTIRMSHKQIMGLVSGTTVFHIYGRDMAEFELSAPSLYEQKAIVEALSHMDAEIEALERRGDKARQIKQGMMQQLLTGRVRLVEPGQAA